MLVRGWVSACVWVGVNVGAFVGSCVKVRGCVLLRVWVGACECVCLFSCVRCVCLCV